MNRDLISNPFLFPPTGDNEEERGLFQTHAEKIKRDILSHLFQVKDFDQVWEAAKEETLDKKDNFLFPVPISSPTISTASTELLSFDSDMDDDLMSDFNNFDFDCEFSPILPENNYEKDSFPLKEKSFSEDDKQGFVQTTNQALHQINDLGELTMFPASNNNFGKKMAADDFNSQLIGSDDLINGEAMLLPGSSGFNILDLTADDPPVPSELTTINPTAITVYPVGENAQPIHVKVEPISTQVNSRPGRQRRKSVVLNRNIEEDSPMTFHQDEESVDLEALTKPEMKPVPSLTMPFALATLNGTSSRSRDVSASSSYASFAAPSPSPSSKARASKNSEAEKRKRKYECEDETDPSVKNAKAAKMNRDKKKMQMQQLQKQVTELSGENQDLKQKLEEERRMRLHNDEQNTQQINILTQMLHTEQSKNAANSKQKVTMFDLMRNMVSAVQPAPTVICLSDRLGSTPMPDPSEMDNIRAMTSQQPATGLDTYLTVKDPNID